jgi:hypothetical protein
MNRRSLPITFAALLAAGVALLAGCATPDFRPFAAETAALGGAISTEQAEVVARLAQTIAKTQTRNANDGRVADFEKQKASYAANAAAVNVVMTTAVSYSTALVELAAAGETGAKAVTSLTDTLKGFSSALGVALPVASIPAWASALAQEVAQAVTRIQAQNSLADATKAADPTITRIAAALSELYEWPKGPQALIVSGVQASEEGVLQDIAGRHRMAFYRGINVKEVSVDKRPEQSRLEYFFGEAADRVARQSPAAGICGIAAWVPMRDEKGAFVTDKNGNPVFVAEPGTPKDDPNCLTGQTLQGLNAIVTLLAGIEPQFQAYTRELALSRKWREQRQEASVRISQAAKQWAAEHARLAEALEECGGLRALRRNCGNLTFSNFKLAVERIRMIAGKGGE